MARLAPQWIPASDIRDAAPQLPPAAFVDSNGIARQFRPGIVLVKFKGEPSKAARVPPGRELEMLQEFQTREDVEFAELDLFLTRQSIPNDPQIPEQWHQQVIHSSNAWALTFGHAPVTLAILDTPFQMNHPDLAANAVPGWDMIRNQPVNSAVGFYHSTIGAGMAAAVINNGQGVAGVVNCKLMPVDIGDFPSTSDMANAIRWAADHDIRVVNLSWDGAYSSIINEAGLYLKQTVGGMLFMAGVNNPRPNSPPNFLNYPAQPHIYAISMTDRDDQIRSSYGPHIDFAAPGYLIYTTTTNSTYEVDSGSSYACPLAAGMAAYVMSVNPDLSPDEVEQILIRSTIDLGAAGYDQFYGWGRLDMGLVAREVFQTLPVSRLDIIAPGILRIPFKEGADYELFRATSLQPPDWAPVQDAQVRTNGAFLEFIVPPESTEQAYFQATVRLR